MDSLIDEFIGGQPDITRNEYGEAVLSLFKLAQDNTSGSRAAAQVLLSAYCGSAFQLDVTDLCLLDRHYRKQALIVMDARAQLGIEPHELIKNGSDHLINCQIGGGDITQTTDGKPTAMTAVARVLNTLIRRMRTT